MAATLALLALLGAVEWVYAAPQAGNGSDNARSAGGDRAPGSPAPTEVIDRDAQGRVTIRAVRVTLPTRIDGNLDEAVYTSVSPMSDFLQQEPQEGAPATEKTDVWLSYDADNVYVAFRCWESRPDMMVMNEMRRDHNNVFQNDNIAILFDTFNDQRNGIEFAVTPVGGRWDGQLTNERQFSADWNPVWDLAVGRFEGGWTVEMAIPFKSLRYQPGREQVWRFNARRINRWKNETSFLTRIPASLSLRGLWTSSLAATLVGLEVPSGSRNLEIKPYAVSSVTSDLRSSPPVNDDVSGDIGVDVKYGITQNITSDFTYNTDFAQVEADEQQVNLTRFSLFFPEKREFFLENQGLFGFGGVGTGGAGDTPILFYSRRIGFDQGQAIPIDAGGRVTGRVGRTSFGVLNVQAGDDEQTGTLVTNFTVARVRRDVLRRSSIGMIFTDRSRLQTGHGRNDAYGVDANLAFFNDLAIIGYWARTHTEGGRSASSYRAQLDYSGDRYGVQLEQLGVGAGFNPEVGFVRRDDIRRSSGQLRFSPRPRAIRSVRKFVWTGTGTYLDNAAGEVQARDFRGEFGIEFQNSDRFSVSYGSSYELIPIPSRILGVSIPVGGYDYSTTRAGFTFGQQRRASAALSIEHGEFYSGRKTTFTASQGRINLTSQLAFEPTYQGNWVELDESRTTTHLAGTRVVYTMTPTMFTMALVQYNTGGNAVFANVRLRWEYQPGSELFVVYNEQRDTLTPRYPDLVNRSFIVKVNRLLRF